MRFGKDDAARIMEQLPIEIRDDQSLLVVPCERRQGFAMAGDQLAWVGVGVGGKRDPRAHAWTVAIAEVARVLWNRIDILDRQELTVWLMDGRELNVAPLDPESWTLIRARLEASSHRAAGSTIGERLGGFLPADSRASRSAIVYVDSDVITWQGRQYRVDGSTTARFGYRPGTSAGGAFPRGYGLQDLFTRRSPHGMEPYVHIEGVHIDGIGWQIDTAIAARDPAYAMALVERINDLGKRMRSDSPP